MAQCHEPWLEETPASETRPANNNNNLRRPATTCRLVYDADGDDTGKGVTKPIADAASSADSKASGADSTSVGATGMATNPKDKDA
jgi:hypothetical protein